MNNGYGSPVEVLSAPPVTEAYGVQSRNWELATPTAYLAWVGTAASVEQSQTATSVQSSLQVHLPAAAVVTASDRLRFRGDLYDISGDPRPAFRRGVLHHLELTVERIEYAP